MRSPPARPPDSAGPVSHRIGSTLRIDGATGVVGPVEAEVDGATVLLRRTGDAYRTATLAEVRVGGRVEVWVDGPVLASFPARAHAEAVVLLP